MKDNPGNTPQERIIRWMKEYSGDNLFRELRESRDLLECLVNREVSVLIYTLYLVKVSSLHELQRLTNVSSFSIIEHRIVKLINAGLVNIISKNDSSYETYMRCWSRMHPNTRYAVVLYSPTKKTESFIHFLSERFESLVYGAQKNRLVQRGELFLRLYENITRKIKDEERARIRSVDDVFGSCSRCQKIIRHSDFDNGKAEEINGEVCCSSCILQMYNTGELKARRMSK